MDVRRAEAGSVASRPGPRDPGSYVVRAEGKSRPMEMRVCEGRWSELGALRRRAEVTGIYATFRGGGMNSGLPRLARSSRGGLHPSTQNNEPPGPPANHTKPPPDMTRHRAVRDHRPEGREGACCPPRLPPVPAGPFRGPERGGARHLSARRGHLRDGGRLVSQSVRGRRARPSEPGGPSGGPSGGPALGRPLCGQEERGRVETRTPARREGTSSGAYGSKRVMFPS